MEFRVLGAIEAAVAGERVDIGSTRSRELLALLLIYAGEPVATDQIIEALWDAGPPAMPKHAVQQAVSRLRQALDPSGADPSPIRTDQGGYLVDLPPGDVAAFERLTREGMNAADADPAFALSLAEEALALWRGAPYPDVAYRDFAQEEIRRLHDLRLDTLDVMLRARLSLGHHREVVADVEALVRAEPVEERFWGHLMVALYRSGRQVDALRAFERARTALADGLGVPPGPELRTLEAAVFDQEPGLLSPSVAGDDRVVAARVPFPVSSFLGREVELASLSATVAGSRLVTVTGPGGVGKTRLVIEFGHRFDATAVMLDLDGLTQGIQVLAALRTTFGMPADAADPVRLAAEYVGSRSMLLIVDGCEGVVDEARRAAEHLLVACPRLIVLATSRRPLRADGEATWELGPLGLPDGPSSRSGEAAESVRLFLSRAADTGTPIGPEGMSAIEALVRDLDGLPLAIELAARASAILSIDVLRHRLALGPGLVGEGDPTTGRKHRSLEASVRWSYDLLTGVDRDVFVGLGRLHGWFTMTEAREACAPLNQDALADSLTTLVEHSLLERKGVRYRMLNVIRACARSMDRPGASPGPSGPASTGRPD